MDKEIQFLKDFAEGNIETAIFEQKLYENNNLQFVLEDDSLSWSGTYMEHTTPYLYLLELDYKNINGKLNAQGAVELFLQKKGIPFNKNENYQEDHLLILETQPKYLDVDMAFIEKYILPRDKSKSKIELRNRIKENFKKYFKYQNKPPRWIQSPKWPIRNEIPLFFLGQIEIKNCDLFHDDGFIYIFIDRETKETETVMQFY
jgi:hypothetical protein